MAEEPGIYVNTGNIYLQNSLDKMDGKRYFMVQNPIDAKNIAIRLLHSKLRSRLDTENASKLVFFTKSSIYYIECFGIIVSYYVFVSICSLH